MKVNYDAFLPYISIHVPNCPELLILEKINQCVIDFCIKTGFLRKELDGFYTSESGSEYDIDTPIDTTIDSIISVSVNNRQIEAKNVDDLDSDIGGNWRELIGVPSYYYMPTVNKIVFVPIPLTRYPVRIIATLKPTQTAKSIDEIIFQEFKNTIVDGVLSSLFIIPQKEWSNPELSVFIRKITKNRQHKQN